MTGKWADLAKDSFPERIPKQLRERWIFELAPEIKKGMWTPEEEELLIARHKLVKNKWAEIAKVRALPIPECSRHVHAWGKLILETMLLLDEQTHQYWTKFSESFMPPKGMQTQEASFAALLLSTQSSA